MSEYVLTDHARQDMIEIWEYIARDHLDVADRVVLELELAMQRLADWPKLGHRRADVDDPRYRFWVVYSYVIVYDPATEPMQILRVIHGARDIRAVLSEDRN